MPTIATILVSKPKKINLYKHIIWINVYAQEVFFESKFEIYFVSSIKGSNERL